MVKPIDIIYKPSESIIAQGKEVAKKRRSGFYEGQGGNGTYRMNKPSTAVLVFQVEGQTIKQSVKGLIRDAYNIRNVGEKQTMRFFDDVKSGKIKLEYEDGELVRND